MSSQKKSSTKGKGMTPSSPGQRQGSNSKKSRSVSLKANVMSKPIKAPVSKMASFHSSRPIQSLMDRGILVKHVELVSSIIKPQLNQDVKADVLFQFLRLRCNPGSKKTFNWLSTLAVQYEFFKFRKLKFHFVTRQSTAHVGGIIMTPDYDAADAQVPLSEQTIYNNRGTVDGPVWQELSLHVECSAMNRLYKSHVIMSDDRFITTTQDQKTIDPCQVFVLTDDTSNNGATQYGKLFVEYEVELTEPQVVTEPTNVGGLTYDANYGGTFILNNSARPITGIYVNNNDPLSVNPAFRVDPGLALPVNQCTSVNFPTATLCQMMRDWEGIITTKLVGTGFGSAPQLFKTSFSNNPNDQAGVNDTAIGQSLLGSVVNAGGSQMMTQFKASLKTGDYLKILTPNASSLASFLLELGGQQLVNIL